MSTNRMVCPGEIHFLIHCATTAAVYPTITSRACQEWVSRFLRDGILEPTIHTVDPTYELTVKGMMWLVMILNTPYPNEVSKWIDPRTGKILTKEE